MTLEKQRAALKELFGSKHTDKCDGWINSLFSDLNAVHALENRLDYDQRKRFLNFLTLPMPWDFPDGIGWYASHATAIQRVEALLRTLGKWED